MIKRAAIILAGGKGRRFQAGPGPGQDKALAVLNGKPLLVHALGAVRSSVDEVFVCVNDETRKTKYEEVLGVHGFSDTTLLIDEKFDSLGGPLVAIHTGLKAAKANSCLTLPGDMPLVQPPVVEYMFELAEKAEVVVPAWPNGRLETLFMTLKRQTAFEVSWTLCLLKRPRSDDLARGASNVIFASTVGEISRLDPELKTFVNINAPADLEILQPRRVDGAVIENLHIKRGSLPVSDLWRLRLAAADLVESRFEKAAGTFSLLAKEFESMRLLFWTAVCFENEAKSLIKFAKHEPILRKEKISLGRAAFSKAAQAYGLEAEKYEKCRCAFLAGRALNDKAWCEARAEEL